MMASRCSVRPLAAPLIEILIERHHNGQAVRLEDMNHQRPPRIVILPHKTKGIALLIGEGEPDFLQPFDRLPAQLSFKNKRLADQAFVMSKDTAGTQHWLQA